ncbi:MAG: hypothetical protein ACXAC8_10250 [Candidatus Hodarchaeales archaeon]|jgi:hypothetical protein
MAKKKRTKQKKELSCVNHPDRFETAECERCHQHYCSECYVEDWSVNFFQQFIGQKRNFVQKVYCEPCQKRVVRVRMVAYLGLLVLFGAPFVVMLLMAFI